MFYLTLVAVAMTLSVILETIDSEIVISYKSSISASKIFFKTSFTSLCTKAFLPNTLSIVLHFLLPRCN